MTNFRNLQFVKNATNKYGAFRKGDRAQGRFPKALIDSYLKHGILQEVAEPVALDKPIKSYATPRVPRMRATKTTK